MNVLPRRVRTARARRALNPPPGATHVLSYREGWWDLLDLGCFLSGTEDRMSVSIGGGTAQDSEDELRKFAAADLGCRVRLERFGHYGAPAFWVTKEGLR